MHASNVPMFPKTAYPPNREVGRNVAKLIRVRGRGRWRDGACPACRPHPRLGAPPPRRRRKTAHRLTNMSTSESRRCSEAATGHLRCAETVATRSRDQDRQGGAPGGMGGKARGVQACCLQGAGTPAVRGRPPASSPPSCSSGPPSPRTYALSVSRIQSDVDVAANVLKETRRAGLQHLYEQEFAQYGRGPRVAWGAASSLTAAPTQVARRAGRDGPCRGETAGLGGAVQAGMGRGAAARSCCREIATGGPCPDSPAPSGGSASCRGSTAGLRPQRQT